MKSKRIFPILLILSTFVISGCGKTSSVSEYSENKESKIDSSLNTTSEDIPGSKPSSSQEAISSVKPISSSEELSSSEPASSSLPPVTEYLRKDVCIELAPMLRDAGSSYYDYYTYDDEFFLSDPKDYNEELSKLSLGTTFATATEMYGTFFFEDIEFDHVVCHDYDGNPTEDTIGYFFGHRHIGEVDIVAVFIRGFNYGKEWANNFLIGKEGDHEGFNTRAQEIHQALKDYIPRLALYYPISCSTVKLWLTGYSRGGAVANSLASLIMKDTRFTNASDNMYVYTFEAPASLCEENAIAYPNVHNIINEADIITFIPPTQYGLHRCGVDYPIYNEDISTLIKSFDEEIEIPEFKAITDLTSEPLDSDAKVRDYVLTSIFEKDESSSSDKSIFANTREEYVDNYQDGIGSGIGYIFALSSETRSAMLTAIQNMGFGAYTIIGDTSGTALKNFIQPYLDQDNVEYDEDELLSDCAVLIKAVQNLFLQVLLMYLSEDYKPSLDRLLDMHYPEVTYTLLKYAHEQD